MVNKKSTSTSAPAAPKPAAASKPVTGVTVTVFAADYWLNGQVLYAAGQPIPTTEHTQQLLDDGIQGEIRPADAAQASAQDAE